MVNLPLTNSGFDIQKAIVDLMLADTDLAALVGTRIHDSPPPDVVFPYVIVGDMSMQRPELTSTSMRTIYNMEISALLGPNPADTTYTLGFEAGHQIMARVFELLHNSTLTLENGRTVQRLRIGTLRTERVRGQLDSQPDYRIVTAPIEVWVWQSRTQAAPEGGGS